MAKDRKPGVKAAAATKTGPFNLLALAAMESQARRSWFDNMPEDLKIEIRRTIEEISRRPPGAVNYSAIARVLTAECQRRNIPLCNGSKLRQYFAEQSNLLRAKSQVQ